MQSNEIRDQVQFLIQVPQSVLGNTATQDINQELVKNQ